MIMKRFLVLGALALAGCAWSPSTGGSGQLSSTIDGIDVWTGGNPSRPYQVMDTVQRVGPDSSATYGQEEELIAADAKERGADGMVVLSTVMVVSRMDMTMDRPVMAPKVQAEVIKYQ